MPTLFRKKPPGPSSPPRPNLTPLYHAPPTTITAPSDSSAPSTTTTTTSKQPTGLPSPPRSPDRDFRAQIPTPADSVPINSHATLQTLPASSQATATVAATRKTSSRYALADFDLIRTLGTGSFGRVHLSKSRHNGRGYAIKVLNKQKVVSLKQVEHTNSEREMLGRVRHPFLVNLWGTFSDSFNLYMVMDFVSGGELFNLLRKSQRFPDPVAKFFGAEVALALDYLHCMDIVYRDLKPENILLAADGHIKITDFGFAKLVPDITWTLCGTPDYLAPEIVQSKGYNKSVDWYALGVLIFEMLAGYPPFYCEEESPMRLYEKIIAGKVRYPSYFSPQAKDLLKSLLTSDLSKRFGNLANGSRDIFHHIWFGEVDWERLYRKEIPAPYVPRVANEWDSSNFDHYDEASLEEYGKTGPDPFGALFPGF
ncbi:uncharacterized protein MELLADRAFT_78487 [Melampsora larici-populina 98AG31]|uniref:cAMP-dependent protein kinase n=1 Tax=Melampsora larici-populina (strain 98AG31 / pathotype 3-4-7) TaxID=747676 RepID=F4RUY9_MELLP|nr:uncharacterized protein MELLADRAFT_78487 [Melampsora larici-populina 98AG31]EGG03778.1 hypothetical protein MELLADRAFT_78487 [Melampsora larici-populina 98AG31]